MNPEGGFNKNLHGLRGLLALGVLAGHCGIADVASVSVWFFFVLSGYLLGGIYRDGMRLDQLGAYAIRRVARLVPLYATVLVVIAILPAGLYAAVMPSIAAVQLDAVAASFPEHITFRQANIHFWTLAQEMAAYGLIAVLMLARRRMNVALFVALCLSVALVSELFVRDDVLPMRTDHPPRPFYALHFIVGMVAAMIPRRGASKPWASMTAIVLLAAILVAGVFSNVVAAAFGESHWHHLIPAQVWALIGAVIVLGLAHGTDRLDRLAFFGTISYGIYVFHFLVVLAIAGRLSAVQTVVIVGAVSIPLAWLSYRFIEAPCIAFAHRVAKRSRPGVVMAAGN